MCSRRQRWKVKAEVERRGQARPEPEPRPEPSQRLEASRERLLNSDRPQASNLKPPEARREVEVVQAQNEGSLACFFYASD